MEPSQRTPLSVEQCKDLLRTVAKVMCVRADLISTRLLSAEDKQDMLNGDITIDDLLIHVKVWKENGMCNYADGSGEPYKPPNS
jgi:hypothetical protein